MNRVAAPPVGHETAHTPGVTETLSTAKVWPRQLAALVDVLSAHFQRRGQKPDAAITEAQGVVLEIAFYMGGHHMYLPKGDRLRAALTHSRIWHQFDGRNTAELAYEFGLSHRHVERVLAQQKAIRKNGEVAKK